MQKFTEELLVESSGKNWVLKRAFTFYYESKYSIGLRINLIVPEGFVTDFASTPKLLYPIFPPIGIYNKAAMVHDYLYSKECNLSISRVQADVFFLQAMEVLKVVKWKRYVMFLAVRVFGKFYFRK
jgi:hypothetical protein